MANFYVRWGADVDPYVRRLASQHINTLSAYCDGVAERVMASRAKKGLPTITQLVDCTMVHELAHHRFRKFGFHFVLNETPNQRRNARKCEFVLNFVAAPTFAPQHMPQRLRRRQGKALSANPPKPKGKRRVSLRAALGWLSARVRYELYNTVTAVIATTTSARTLRAMAQHIGTRVRTLRDMAHKLWRRRPHVAFGSRRLNQLLTRMSEPLTHASARAWLEPRQFGEQIGLPLLLYVLASNEQPIELDALFREPPEERERLPV